MDFSYYQQMAKVTAVYPPEFKLIYPGLGIGNEAGEVQGKIKKVLRDCGGEVTPEARGSILKELGDVLWYAAMICEDLGADLNQVAQDNLTKLVSRKERGVISGSGDNR